MIETENALIKILPFFMQSVTLLPANSLQYMASCFLKWQKSFGISLLRKKEYNEMKSNKRC
jgi:hypothetical protein